jgi:hypothetical protein
MTLPLAGVIPRFVAAAFLPTARRFRVRAAFCPGVSSVFAIGQFYLNPDGDAPPQSSSRIIRPDHWGVTLELQKLHHPLLKSLLWEISAAAWDENQ